MGDLDITLEMNTEADVYSCVIVPDESTATKNKRGEAVYSVSNVVCFRRYHKLQPNLPMDFKLPP